MSDVLHHRKVITGVSDSPDTNLLQPSDWNDGLKFQGGANGALLVRDTTDGSFGASWTSNPVLNSFFTAGVAPASPVNGQWWWEASGPVETPTFELKTKYLGEIFSVYKIEF